MSDILESLAKTENLKTLQEVIELTELDQTLKSIDSCAIFAPTDEAFDRLEEGFLESLKSDREKLKRIVAYHVSFGDVRAEDLLQTDEVATLEGSVIGVESSNGKIKLNDANVIKSDLLADNGVIHIIDRVLTPALVLSE
jgi:uncharacterized surface protein with fasciclin (FAS1) repeats